jgi:hypothetical protein
MAVRQPTSPPPSSAPRPSGGHVSPTSLSFSRIDASFYHRVFVYLRGQNTILKSIQRTLDQTPESANEDDRSSSAIFKQIIGRLIAADHATLFQDSSHFITEVRTCLSHRLTPAFEKIGASLISSFLALSRLLTVVSFNSVHPNEGRLDFRPERDSLSPLHFPPPDGPPLGRRGKTTTSMTNFSLSVVCRICEKSVPLFLIDAHSRSCALAYESTKSVASIDDRIARLQSRARKTVLGQPWPGPERIAVGFLIPILHVDVLLRHAIAVDTSLPAAVEDLDLIADSLVPIASSVTNPLACEIVRKASVGVSDKLAAASKMSEAIRLVQRTSLSPSGSAVSDTTIADFKFVKRISSGAYARVFLALKIRTGDIYAIKVIPKTGLRQKNQVRRVLAEKDILLNVSSPFMIKFCMFLVTFGLIPMKSA